MAKRNLIVLDSLEPTIKKRRLSDVELLGTVEFKTIAFKNI